MRTNLARITGLAASCVAITFSVVLLAPASYGEDETWTYTCDEVTLPADPGSGYGKKNCAASNGAPENGAITKDFEIKQRNGSGAGDLECVHQKKNDTSKASLKDNDRVDGYFCRTADTDH
ncbi:hypothetical protein ACWIGW_11140 [Nocardia brasiliensis]